MDGAKKRREKPCFLAPRSVTSIRLTLSHFLYYLLFEAYRDEMNAIWYQKRKEFHNGVHTVRYKGAWLLVLSPFLSLSFPFYSTFLKIVVWLLCSSLSLSLAVSFRTVLLKSRPCCMFKKESLEFDIGTPRYCLRSRLKIRRLRNRVFFWNARLLPPPLSFSVYYPIPPSTIKRHFSFDSVSFLRRKYSTLGGCYFNMRIYRGGIIGSGIGCAFRLHGIIVDVNAYPLIEENGSSLWFCFWVKKSIVFKFNFRRICVLLDR